MFLLSNVFQISRYNNLPGFSDARLMGMRAFNEAAPALVLWTALQHRSLDDVARRAADDHVGLFTPLIKEYLTDILLGQQVYGGHGNIAERGA